MDLYRRKPNVDWLKYRHTRPHLAAAPPYTFAHARTALKFGLQNLSIQPGDAVLCPDYICHSLEAVFTQAGLRVIYHPVTADLTPDWPGLMAVATPTTRALVMVHYFGQPQDVGRFQSVCQARGWWLIDDNAHGHGARHQGQWLGACGDLGVTSPGKLLAVRNGGFLYEGAAGGATPPAPPAYPVAPIAPCWRWLRARLRRSIDAVPALRRGLFRAAPYDSQAAFRDEVIGDWAMDAYTYAQVATTDFAAMRAARKRLAAVWAAFAGRHGLAPVFAELAPDAMPLVHAARTAGSGASAAWFQWGHRAGIDVHSWPTLPASVVHANGSALRLWEQTVCFPIHQAMSPERLAERLRHLEAAGAVPAG